MPDLAGGGAERVMLHLAEGLGRRGATVTLVLADAVGPNLTRLPAGVRLEALHSGGALRSLLPLRRYLQRARPDVLISAHEHTTVAALVAARGLPVRTLVTLHNTFSVTRRHAGGGRARLVNALLPPLARRADALVAVSNGVARDFARVAGLEPRRVQTIYNPVISETLFAQAALPAAHPWLDSRRGDDLPVILASGRLTPQKDFATLLHAFRRVAQLHPARLIILGEGDGREGLEALVTRLGLDAWVTLPGFVANPYSFLARAHAFALSSRWEGLPTVLIEALALGVPVVATDCPSGPREILAGGRYGQLVPVGDSAALTRALLETLRAPRQAPPEATRFYRLEVATDAYLRLIGELMGEGPADAPLAQVHPPGGTLYES